MNIRSLILTLTLLLPGCAEYASPQPVEAALAKPEMFGMSKQEIVTCLGQPELKWTDGPIETWQFTYDTCTVSLTVGADNKVKAVDYSIKTVRDKSDKSTDPLPTEAEQCAHVPEVVSCVRWLRQ